MQDTGRHGAAEPRLGGTIADRIIAQLAIETPARSVWLSRDTRHHIQTQRGLGLGDADFVLAEMGLTVEQAHYVMHEDRDRRRVRLIRRGPLPERLLGVSVKFVAAAQAASGQDEIWVNTAYPINWRKLTRLRKVGTLQEVSWGPV